MSFINPNEVLNTDDMLDFDFDLPILSSIDMLDPSNRAEDLATLSPSLIINNNLTCNEPNPQQIQWTDAFNNQNSDPNKPVMMAMIDEMYRYPQLAAPVPHDQMKFATNEYMTSPLEPYQESVNSYDNNFPIQFSTYLFPQTNQNNPVLVTADYDSPLKFVPAGPYNKHNQLQELPESVSQINGQLLSVKEFNDHIIGDTAIPDSPDLSCREDLENFSAQNSVASANTVQTAELKIEPIRALKNDEVLYFSKPLTKNKPKSYFRAYKSSRRAKDLTYSAANGLMMLSELDKRKEPRSKMPRGEWSRLEYSERMRIKRERNRVAAKKCRQKKLHIIERLDEIHQSLIDDNHKCEIVLRQQRAKLTNLQMMLLKHKASESCQIN